MCMEKVVTTTKQLQYEDKKSPHPSGLFLWRHSGPQVKL